MISLRALLVRQTLKLFADRSVYVTSNLPRYRKAFDRNLRLLFPTIGKVNVNDALISGVKVRRITTSQAPLCTIIYLHGGGFVLGSLSSFQQHTRRLAHLCNAEVVAIDYGLSPENPYPVALEQIQKVWKQLLTEGLDASKTVFIGDSAGGNLALASSLQFREAKLQQPACLVLISPALDGTMSGESYSTRRNKEVLFNVEKFQFFTDAYAQNQNKRDPFVSPIYATLEKLPPILVHIGTEELLYSDSETIVEHAKRDGTDAQLYIGEGMWHAWHFFASYVPEAKSAMLAIADYISKRTG